MTHSTDATAGQQPPATVFGLWADPVLVLALSAAWVALAIVFNGEPEIDRAISSWFYAAADCPKGASTLACGGRLPTPPTVSSQEKLFATSPPG